MSNNVNLPGSGTIIESIDQGGGVERQVVTVGSIGKAGSETQIGTTIPVSIDQANKGTTDAFTLSDLPAFFRELLRSIRVPLWFWPASNAIRVVNVNSAGAIDTLGTVTTVTTISQFSGISTLAYMHDQMNTAYNLGVRSRIT